MKDLTEKAVEVDPSAAATQKKIVAIEEAAWITNSNAVRCPVTYELHDQKGVRIMSTDTFQINGNNLEIN